jgi:hypothetical protein
MYTMMKDFLLMERYLAETRFGSSLFGLETSPQTIRRGESYAYFLEELWPAPWRREKKDLRFSLFEGF